MGYLYANWKLNQEEPQEPRSLNVEKIGTALEATEHNAITNTLLSLHERATELLSVRKYILTNVKDSPWRKQQLEKIAKLYIDILEKILF